MPLDAGLVALVLFAALLHAGWNALVKVDNDRMVAMALMCLAGGAAGAVLVAVAPPLDPAAWPYLLASAAVHHGYYFCLIQSYRHGDLSHVYPMARGIGPFIVALAAAPLAGELLSPGQMVGVGLVSLGITSLAFAGGVAACGRDWHPNAFAFLTGLTIAAYTLIDGLGARASGAAFAYVGWLNIVEAPFVPLLALALRRGRLAPYLRHHAWRGLLAGAVSIAAYGIALWAMTRGSLAHVAALRETSVIFAALIGTALLGERFGAARALAATLVAAGLALMNFLR